VAVVEIRGYPLAETGRVRGSETPGLFAAALEVVSAPLQAFLGRRPQANHFRGQEMLATASAAFVDSFIRREIFELDEDVSLNWYLADGMRHDIAQAAGRQDAQLRDLAEWLR
jgi:hypothetical protein